MTHEIKRALEAATPGPWLWHNEEGLQKANYWWLGPGILLVNGTDGTPGGYEIDRANAHLIAKAPEWLAKLLTVAEAAENLRFHQRAYMSFKKHGDDNPEEREMLGGKVGAAADRLDEALRNARGTA